MPVFAYYLISAAYVAFALMKAGKFREGRVRWRELEKDELIKSKPLLVGKIARGHFLFNAFFGACLFVLPAYGVWKAVSWGLEPAFIYLLSLSAIYSMSKVAPGFSNAFYDYQDFRTFSAFSPNRRNS